MCLNKDEIAIHGYHCRGDMAVCMHKVLAIPQKWQCVLQFIILVLSVELGCWIPIVSGIPLSLSFTPDNKTQDSGFPHMGQDFHGPLGQVFHLPSRVSARAPLFLALIISKRLSRKLSQGLQKVDHNRFHATVVIFNRSILRMINNFCQ